MGRLSLGMMDAPLYNQSEKSGEEESEARVDFGGTPDRGDDPAVVPWWRRWFGVSLLPDPVWAASHREWLLPEQQKGRKHLFAPAFTPGYDLPSPKGSTGTRE